MVSTSWRASCAEDADDEALVEKLVEIVNKAYKRGEEGMWRDATADRTNPEEMKHMLKNEDMLLLFDDKDDAVLGSVMCKAPFKDDDDELAELGMLAVAEEATGQGLGRELIDAAEEHARSEGCSVMRLEILSPAEYEHPFKQRLHDWYCRLGYNPDKTEDFEESYPRLADLLAVKCKFQVYHKPLEGTD